MTLQDFIESLKDPRHPDEELPKYPDIFSGSDFINAVKDENYCAYAAMKYIRSQKFQDDMEKCLSEYNKALYEPYNNSWFKLTRDESGEFTTNIEFGGWTIT